MAAISAKGLKNIRVAASGLFAVHEPLVRLMENGVITLDLEDSVPSAEKESARQLVKKHIKEMSTTGSEAWVRVNAWAA